MSVNEAVEELAAAIAAEEDRLRRNVDVAYVELPLETAKVLLEALRSESEA